MYLNTETLEYGLSELEVKRRFPRVAFAQPFVPPAPYAVEFPAPKPEYDPLTHQCVRTVPELTVLGKWEQRYTVELLEEGVAEANQTKAVSDAVESKLNQITNDRDATLMAGMPYTFGLIDDVVQTRPQDQVNLIIIRDNARDVLAADITDPVLEFRAESDTSYWLTATEVLAMTSAATAFGYTTYKTAWERKTALAAIDPTDLDALAQIAAI